MGLADIVQRGWNAVGNGNFDGLVTDYMEDMKFIMPGQADVLEGRKAFRDALNNLGDILPPGFEVTGVRQIEGINEVVSIVGWKSEKISDSQMAIFFKFEGDNIYEERWFVDTEQWKDSF